MKRAFRNAGLKNRLQVVNDGEAAIQYLSGIEDYADREKYPLPDFIFLDLKMPIMNGFDVLNWIREQPSFEIPVAVLSSSPEERDRRRSRELGASCYLVKPPTAEMLQTC